MQNDKAVSPVVGVILMVAFTVIIAGAIALFVFNMAASNIHTKEVSASAVKDSNGMITVIYHGGPDQNMVTGLSVTMNGKNVAEMQPIGNRVEPGKTASFQGSPGKDSVIVTAHYDDSTNQVILIINV
jgi:flagellin-like protein